jgi:hypothetical protein
MKLNASSLLTEEQKKAKRSYEKIFQDYAGQVWRKSGRGGGHRGGGRGGHRGGNGRHRSTYYRN